MAESPVAIIATGVANTASVVAAFARLGVNAALTQNPDVVAAAPAAVLPGVGSFAAGMEFLTRTGIADVVRDRLAADRPLLAVCLGFQLLGESSDESPGVTGLRVTGTHAARFPTSVTVPHFGWNLVTPHDGFPPVTPGYAYFANSFRVTDPPAGWSVAACDHAGPFVAAMQRGTALACQFHPELSGPWGLGLMGGWLERVAPEAAAC